MTSDPANRGLTAVEIREMAKDWIDNGGQISCVEERREGYRDRRHYHYDVVIDPLDGFPSGLYVYMELDTRGGEPTVDLLNAHPPRSR